MKITYTAPNRSHHYPFAEAMNKAGHLHAFVSGFSRFSPRSRLDSIGNKLKRYDHFQNLYLASNKFKFPVYVQKKFNRLSNAWLDSVSYKWANDSDFFIYYRTQGYKTARKIHKENRPCICITEEVNSHIEIQYELLQQEYQSLYPGKHTPKSADYELRLKVYDETDYILCASNFVINSFIEKGIPPHKLLKVVYGFTLQGINSVPEKKYSNDKFRVLYVGQVHYRKGLRYAIEAFKKLNHSNKEFIIVGPLTQDTGLNKAAIPKEVKFTGPLKGKNLHEQYEQADVFLLPSIEDGFGLVAMEAMSFGVPVITTSNTGACDVIKQGKEGFIVPPFNSSAIAERLNEIAEDKNMRFKMSSSALVTSKTLGNWDVATENLIALLNERKMKLYSNSF